MALIRFAIVLETSSIFGRSTNGRNPSVVDLAGWTITGRGVGTRGAGGSGNGFLASSANPLAMVSYGSGHTSSSN